MESHKIKKKNLKKSDKRNITGLIQMAGHTYMAAISELNFDANNYMVKIKHSNYTERQVPQLSNPGIVQSLHVK